MMRAIKEALVVNRSDLKVPADQYMQLLELGLKDLTATERRAIFLRFWEPSTIAQVADQMHITWDQADRLIDGAVEKIRETFRRHIQSAQPGKPEDKRE
jgi:DNA-directed RNA polymerase specialized sigma24 family protein